VLAGGGRGGGRKTVNINVAVTWQPNSCFCIAEFTTLMSFPLISSHGCHVDNTARGKLNEHSVCWPVLLCCPYQVSWKSASLKVWGGGADPYEDVLRLYLRIKINAFWGVTSCRHASSTRLLKDHSAFRLKQSPEDKLQSFETSGTTCSMTRHHVPENLFFGSTAVRT
jgi:hypothetical protein